MQHRELGRTGLHVGEIGFGANAIALQQSGIAPGSTSSAETETGEARQQQWQRVVCSAYTDEAFARGVEIIIQGIRGLAAPDPCEWRTPE